MKALISRLIAMAPGRRGMGTVKEATAPQRVRWPRKLARAATCVIMGACLAVSACGDDDASGPGRADKPTATNGYPVTIKNCGRTLTFDRAPSRAVVSFAPLLETFVGLGLADHAIGRALGRPERSKHYVLPLLPEQAAAIEKIAYVSKTFFPPPKEQMLALRADFLLAYGEYDYGDTNKGLATVKQLREAGVQPYTVVCPRKKMKPGQAYDLESIADTYRTILDLGKIFGVSDRARQRVAQMKRQIAALRAKVSGEAPVKVLVFYPGKFPLSATGAGITTDLLNEAGADNVFGKTAHLAGVSREEVAAHPADALVILADFAAAETGRLECAKDARAMFKTFPNMPASKNRRAVCWSGDYFSPGGWRNAMAVEILARKLHPDAFARDGR